MWKFGNAIGIFMIFGIALITKYEGSQLRIRATRSFLSVAPDTFRTDVRIELSRKARAVPTSAYSSSPHSMWRFCIPSLGLRTFWADTKRLCTLQDVLSKGM